jgi:hypothetical protein
LATPRRPGIIDAPSDRRKSTPGALLSAVYPLFTISHLP